MRPMTIPPVAAKKAFLTVFLALLCSGGASLAANLALRTWQSDDGLPDNVVRSVSPGPCGYLWVATQSGLSRFDGVQFEPIQLPAHPQGLDTVVTRMLLARDQSMWLDMGRGDLLRAAVDEGHRLSFTWLTNHSSDTYVLSMAEDSKGALWFSLRNGRVQRIEGNRIIEVGEGEGLPGGNYACWLASDVSGRIWAAKRGHLGVFEGSRFHSTHVLETTSVRLCTRREGGLWVRVGEDLMKFQEGEGPQHVARLFETDRITDSVTMFEDQAGAVWVASAYRGLVRYSDGEVVKVQDSHADVRSICQDREGNVWLGTRGEGLKRARPTPVKLHTQESGLPYAASYLGR
jgi:ligand-binding sensor domain-containing protein